MSNINSEITRLLGLISNFDKDERYMAVSDLCTLMQGDTRLDENMERRICLGVFSRLEDSSNDVQSVAVKCLAILVQKVHQSQVTDILLKLANLILNGKEELRDIYSIGLKTCFAGIPLEAGPVSAGPLSEELLKGFSRDAGVKTECLDLTSELLKKFGDFVTINHAAIANSCVQILLDGSQTSTPVIRKRAISCLASLSAVASDALVQKTVEQLLAQIEELQKQKKYNEQRTLVQAISAISRTAGQRLGAQINRLVPLFISFLKTPDDETMQNETANELRENLLQGLESFVARCHGETSKHLDVILARVREFIEYDPNYTYEDEQDNEDMEMDEGGGEGEADPSYEDYGGDDQMIEDDDTSWKVRRASVCVLRAVIGSFSELLGKIFTENMDLLISRLKEREENVRLEIIACLKALVSATVTPAKPDDSTVVDLTSLFPGKLTRQRSTASLLQDKLDPIFEATIRTLKGKAPLKTKVALFNLLRELIVALRGGLEESQVVRLTPYLCAGLSDRDTTFRLEALQLWHEMLRQHEPQVMQPQINSVMPILIEYGLHADWYKVVSESLQIVSILVLVIRPIGGPTQTDGDRVSKKQRSGMDQEAPTAIDYKPYVEPLFNAVLQHLRGTDIDQEIKESAIAAMTIIIARFGDSLNQVTQIDVVLDLLLQRLENEVTRIASLRALTGISKSSLRIDLSAVKDRAYAELTILLRQQSRVVKQTTLVTLEAFYLATATGSEKMDLAEGAEMKKSASNISAQEDETATTLISEASKLISDSDLHVTHQAISLILTIFEKQTGLPNTSAVIRDETLPRLLELSTSALLSGHALDSLLKLLRSLARNSDSRRISYNELLSMFMNVSMSLSAGPSLEAAAAASSTSVGANKKTPGVISLSKQSANSLAQCIAAIASASIELQTGLLKSTVEQLISMLMADGANSATRLVAVLAIGGIGQNCDLSPNINPPVHTTLLAIFDEPSASEDLKVATATALGSLAMGNTGFFLPVVMKELHEGTEQQRQYLLLSSLREIITLHIAVGDQASVLNADEILSVLTRHREAESEGVRNMVAECLGKMAILFPEKLVSFLEAECTTSTSPLSLWTSVTAVRYMVASQRAPLYLLNVDTMKSFTGLIRHQDLNVRRAALLTLNSVIHHHPKLVKSYFTVELAPILFQETVVKPELQHKVDLGPIKVTVDDGLALRKASFALFVTAVTTIPHIVPMSDLANPYLTNGLRDVPDVQILCCQILSVLSTNAPTVVLAQVEPIIAALAEIFNKKSKGAAAADNAAAAPAGEGDGGDRSGDVLRGALRSLEAMCAIPESASNRKLLDFVILISRRENIAPILKAEFSPQSPLFTAAPHSNFF